MALATALLTCVFVVAEWVAARGALEYSHRERERETLQWLMDSNDLFNYYRCAPAPATTTLRVNVLRGC